MTKFYDAVYSFERVGGYQFVKQTRSAHARDVSLGARIIVFNIVICTAWYTAIHTTTNHDETLFSPR